MTASLVEVRSPSAATAPTGPPAQFRSLYNDCADIDRLKVRLDTFTFWPASAPRDVTPESLAFAGLYYTGDRDATRCFSCQRVFASWREGVDPLLLHRQRAPECAYMKALSAQSSVGRNQGGFDAANDVNNSSRGYKSADLDTVDGENSGNLDATGNLRFESDSTRSSVGNARRRDGNYPRANNHGNISEDINGTLSEDENIQTMRSQAGGGSLERDSIGCVEPEPTNDVAKDDEGEESEEEQNLTAVRSWSRIPVAKGRLASKLLIL